MRFQLWAGEINQNREWDRGGAKEKNERWEKVEGLEAVEQIAALSRD